MNDDPIALLLPDLEEEECLQARRITTFLRLLSSDSRGESAGSSQVLLARAREDLEQDRVVRLANALEELLRIHLEHDLGRDEYSWFGSPKLNASDAWGVIADFRAEWEWLPEVPGPGESALAVAERLLAGLERLQDSRVALWRARLNLVQNGAEVGCASLQSVAKSRGPGMNEHFPDAVAGVAECFLSRGAVREAAAWLASQTDLFCKSRRLAQLDSWTRVLLGERPKGVRDAGPLPAPLCELRERVPELIRCLPGASAGGDRGERWRSLKEWETPVRRESIGASVLAVFAFRTGLARLVQLDVAPALSYGVDAWLAEREDACTDPNDPQHALVVEVKPVLLDQPSSGAVALGGKATVQAALEPILDDHGEVCGWIHVEFDHRATPSRRGFRELAAGWRDKVLNWNSSGAGAGERGATTHQSEAEVAARAAAFHALLESVGLKLKRRHWWGFDCREGDLRLIAQGGEGLADCELQPGQGRALQRSLATSGVVRFNEARLGLAVHSQASSGIVLPIRGSAGLLSCLVIESRRRNDFSATEIDRLVSTVPGSSTRMRVARFSDWHASRFGVPTWFPVERADFVNFAERLGRIATANSPLAISGPAGVGKRVVARWVVFESGRAEQPCVEFSCAGEQRGEALECALSEAAGGSLIVCDLERSNAGLQERLVSLLERDRGKDGRCRLLVVTRVPLAKLMERGVLRDDLALLLGRVTIEIPALARRRGDIPALAQFLAVQVAREEGVPLLKLSDEVLGLLWRQEWGGNVRELEGGLTRLVLAQNERSLDFDLAIAALNAGSNRYLLRLPSLRPQAQDLNAALRTTRTLGGRINKTRAASYLGWDPDTLVARLRDLGIDPSEPPEEDSWSR